MIDMDDINILLIVLSVWTSFWRRSGGQMQFEHDQLKKKIVILCNGIFQNDFSLQPIPSNLQQNNMTKMLSICSNINNMNNEWNEFAQTIKISKEYHIEKKCQTLIIIKSKNEIDKQLKSLKKIICLSTEKWFELKWRMIFGAICNDLTERQNFIRLRLKALLVLSTFCSNNGQRTQHPLFSEIDFAELCLETAELIEFGDKIPSDIRICALLCLKQFAINEQLQSIWSEHNFIPTILRNIINDFEHHSDSLDSILFATHFLNFLHSTFTRTLPQISMHGISEIIDWNGLIQSVLTLISNKRMKEISVLKECATLLFVILAKQRKPAIFIQFNGLSLCFELIDNIISNKDYLTNCIVENYENMKMIKNYQRTFTFHQLQYYTKQHLLSKLIESCMQSVRLSRRPLQYLKDPLVAKTMSSLINKCLTKK